MIKQILRNKLTIIVLLIALTLLAFLRIFESELFYDPFISFFKLEFYHKELPFFYQGKLFLNFLYRYFLNSTISLVIIYFLFKEKQLLKFSIYLYTIFFIILIVCFFGYLNYAKNPDFLFLFYIRRFLIQPILLVLFVPAFYYQKKIK
jgi:exosortase F-associated protein